MAKRADFNAEDWSTVTQAPLLAAAAVIVADKGGTFRESMALGKAYTKARAEHGTSELLDDLLREAPNVDHGTLRGRESVADTAAEALGAALALLQRDAPDEVDAYGDFVRSLAEAVARAHKEGGVLGFGGKEISDAEQSVLDSIDGSLRSLGT